MLTYRPRRWIVHSALFFGAGVFAGLYLPPSWMWLAAGALCALLIFLLHHSGRSVYAGVMLLALFAGLMRCSVSAHPDLVPEGEYHVQATVFGEAQVRLDDGRVAAYLRNVILTDETGKTHQARRLYWTYWPEEGALPPLDGQRVSFDGGVYHPSERANPHGFDFRMYLLQKGTSMGVTSASDLTMSEQADHKNVFIRLRRAMTDRLTLLLGEDSALGIAMLLGDRSDMPEDMADSFNDAGVAHVLSVSGLHVMILYWLAARLINRFSPPQWLTLVLSCLLMSVYCLLVGMQSAMLRSCVLMVYLQLGRVFRRQTDALTALALGFITILLLKPLELFSAGFQMSFSAVLGMTMLGDRMRQQTARIRSRRLQKLVRDYGMTLCASLAVSLPVGWYYHRLSLIGLVINPLLCTLTTLLLPVLIVLLLLSLVSMPMAMIAGKGVALFSRMITHLVQFAAGAPLASVSVPRFPWYVMVALVAAMVLCTRYVLMRKKPMIAAGVLGVGIVLMVLTQPRGVRYIQLALGNADAAIIEDGRETIVIDTGDYGGDLASYLLSTGRKADHLIITHLHSDHMLGIQELMEQRVEIGCMYLSSEAYGTPVAENCIAVIERAKAAGIPVKILSAGDQLAMERVQMDVLWPEVNRADPLMDGNDYAMALRIDLDGVKLLHMSDVSGFYEMAAAESADVIKVAHHGSSRSTGARFLNAVKPRAALVSTSKASTKTIKRLAQAGVIVYDTSKRGALILSPTGEGFEIRGYKE